MKVCELIESLKQMPTNAEVGHLWDGRVRTYINIVWLARNGTVVTSDYSQVCYDEEERPAWAPTGAQDRYWQTEQDPSELDDEC